MSWVQYAVLSSIFTALLLITNRYAMAYGADILSINTVRAACLFFILLPFWMKTSTSKGLDQLYTSGSLWIVMLGGIFGAISWITYYGGMAAADKIGLERTTEVTAINYTHIILIALADVFLLRRTSFDWRIPVGSLLVVLGIMIMTMKPEHWRALLRAI